MRDCSCPPVSANRLPDGGFSRGYEALTRRRALPRASTNDVTNDVSKRRWVLCGRRLLTLFATAVCYRCLLTSFASAVSGSKLQKPTTPWIMNPLNLPQIGRAHV